MKIYNKRGFFSGLICLTVGLAGLAILPFKEFQLRLWLGVLFLLAMAAYQLPRSLSKTKSKEDMLAPGDERDRYLAMRSGHTTVTIMNHLLFAAVCGALILYGLLREPVLLAVGMTLWAVLLVMFFIMLGVNIYYERRS